MSFRTWASPKNLLTPTTSIIWAEPVESAGPGCRRRRLAKRVDELFHALDDTGSCCCSSSKTGRGGNPEDAGRPLAGVDQACGSFGRIRKLSPLRAFSLRPPDADQDAALQDIAKFLALMRIVRVGRPARRQRDQDRFHFIFLGVGNQPADLAAGFADQP